MWRLPRPCSTPLPRTLTFRPFDYRHDAWPVLNLRHYSGWLLCALAWASFFTLKLALSLCLLGVAAEKTLKEAGTDGVAIERFTLFGKTIH